MALIPDNSVLTKTIVGRLTDNGAYPVDIVPENGSSLVEYLLELANKYGPNLKGLTASVVIWRNQSVAYALSKERKEPRKKKPATENRTSTRTRRLYAKEEKRTIT